MILVDTSIWISYFSKGQSEKLDDLITTGLVVVNEIVLAELIPFLIHAKAFGAAESLKAIDLKKIEIFWPGIMQLQELNLKNGINKVGIPDLIIAQQAIRDNLHIWTLDKHFYLMAEHTNLKIYEP